MVRKWRQSERKRRKSRLQESERMASLRSVITVFFCRFIRALFLLEYYCNECVTREGYTSSLTADFWRRADSDRPGQTGKNGARKSKKETENYACCHSRQLIWKKDLYDGAHFYHLWSPTEIVKHDPKRDVIPNDRYSLSFECANFMKVWCEFISWAGGIMRSE